MKNNQRSTKTKQRKKEKEKEKKGKKKRTPLEDAKTQALFFSLTRHLLLRSSMELRHDGIHTFGVTWGRPVIVIFGQSGKQIAGKTCCDGKKRAYPREAPVQILCTWKGIYTLIVE